MLADLNRLILRFAGIKFPQTILRLKTGVCDNIGSLNDEFQRSFHQMWTPSYCNVLIWVPDRAYFVWYYDVVTKLSPTTKRYVVACRKKQGFVPIFPGNRHYPTSRVRFHPRFVNDRYFR